MIASKNLIICMLSPNEKKWLPNMSFIADSEVQRQFSEAKTMVESSYTPPPIFLADSLYKLVLDYNDPSDVFDAEVPDELTALVNYEGVHHAFQRARLIWKNNGKENVSRVCVAIM
jgi:hypothetical protein